jgi:uncharacterized repeat protein (TIGR01451 family)
MTMKCSNRNRPSGTRLAAIAAASLLLAGVHQTAFAAGTVSGTSITNLAKLSYKVGGVDQGDICSSQAGNSTSNGGTGGSSTCVSGTNGALNTSFAVDNKINLAVITTDVTPGVTVTPGQVAATPLPNPPAYLAFTVTNTGNTTQDIKLSNTNPAIGSTSPFGGNSEFAASSCRTFVESNAVADGLQIGTDLEVTYINDLAPDGSKKVYLVCNTPLGATNGQDAVVGLIAEAVDAAGSVGSPSASYTVGQLTAANTQNGVEIVAADGIGSETGDAARDAKFSARDAYIVQSATLSVAKTVTTLCDPFNGNSSPKNIPGAIVTWTITVQNTGAASATLATISDVLNPNTTHDANLVLGATAATCVSAAPGVPESATGRGFQIQYSVARALGGAGGTGYMTGAADGDGATIAGQNVTIDFATALPAGGTYTAGELKAGETATVTFNVTIN